LETHEVLGAHLCLSNPRRRLVHVPGLRVLNPAFAVAEAVWILSGSDADWILQYNQALQRFTDDGTLQGAYGPRLRAWAGDVDQLDRVRTLLTRDPQSRQAVVQLFDPSRDWAGHRDVPCTLGYRFFVRDGALVMYTTMRSQDLWLGFPYDVFAATLIQELLAAWLGVGLGAYHHHVDSLHLYREHHAAAGAMPDGGPPSPEMSAVGVGWEDLDPLLAGVLAGELPEGTGPGWDTFAAVLASYRAWRFRDRQEARALAAGAGAVLGPELTAWYDHLEAR
jgi:thymidylate synthase